ncbi:hypothetical protein [Streptomyces sp. NPDC088915]|uniref:hypothetical protein n=1 Tax=Streptomyces sp. NPDC088915 TaxID=3365912 RepID=UPI00382FD35F
MTTRSTAHRGRPTLLTPVVIEKLGQAVEAGMTRPEAAEVAGISAGSFARWMTRGRAAQNLFDSGILVDEAEHPYGNLYRRIVKADAVRRAAKVGTAEETVLAVEDERPAVEQSTAIPDEPVVADERPAAGRWARFRSFFTRASQAAA